MPLYRFLISLFAIFTLGQALRRGGFDLVAQRLGLGDAAPGPHLWLHGASNGELAPMRHLIEGLLADRSDLSLLITTNSATGQTLVKSWGLPRTTTRAAPVDLGWVNRRVMRRWRIVAHVTLESELWPNRILSCPGPVIILAGRLTAGTARGWSRLGALPHRVLSQISFASAQDRGSAQRFQSLGLQAQAIGPVVNLKTLYRPPEDGPDPALARVFARDRTWLAASTHPGEDETVLEAHRIALQTDPDLRLILAPRHPARADVLASQIRAAGFTLARRSLGDDPAEAQVYLADTMGEMALWYALAGRVFVGGTLTDRGGHTPYEPAAFGAVILHGPDVANHTTGFAALDGLAREIHDGATLAAALGALDDPEAQTTIGAQTRDRLRQGADLDALLTLVLAQLPRTDVDPQSAASH